MIRLVRVVGVAALICTGLVLASIKWPVRQLHLGITQNREAAMFLDSPSAVARYNSRQDTQTPDDQDKTPPLVKQAQVLEGIINPRVAAAPVSAAPAAAPSAAPAPKPAGPSAKFDLVGISFSAFDPASSFAYIRLPDNTYQWIHQGSEIGHLTVKQIKSGSIVCSDGQRMSEMQVEPTINTATMLETGIGAAASGRITAASPASSTRLTGKDEASLNDLVHRLKQELQKENKPNQTDSNAVSPDKAAAVGKLITDIKSSQVGTEEAQNLEKLGEKLNGAKSAPGEEKRRELLRRMSQPRSQKQ